MKANEITTPDQFADFINSKKDFPLEANDIIKRNGWVDESYDFWRVCSSDTERIVFNDNAEAMVVPKEQPAKSSCLMNNEKQIMNKEEVIEKIKRDMSGCYTCSYSCDEQGYNGAFSSQYVDDLFKEENQVDDHNVWCLTDEGWELCEFDPVTNEDIDIHEWAQEFDKDTIEQLKKDIDTGGFYIATFCNDTWGTQKILVW